MILKQPLVIIFLFTRAFGASKPSFDDLCDHMEQTRIDSSPLTGQRELLANVKFPGASLSIYDATKQGEELRARTLNYDIRTVVKELEKTLIELIASGIPPTNVVPIINCFYFEARELITVAQEIQAYTLLKILQKVFIWSDEFQFHQFKALSYLSPWYDEDMWFDPNPLPMDWKKNLRAIFECKNLALVQAVQKSIPPGNELESFNESLLRLCVEFNDMDIFLITRLDPIKLGKHMELMVANNTVDLLKLYQTASKFKYRELKRFPLPDSTAKLDSMMRQEYDWVPRDRFIKRFCKEGWFSFLVHLNKLEPKLIPTERDLELAAEGGWLAILQWAHQLGLIDEGNSGRIAVKLAVNKHLQALDWLMDLNNVTIKEMIVGMVVDAGALKALEHIDEKQPIRQGQQEWADSAAERCQLPVLKWLRKRFGLFPSVEFLGNASAEMLDWIQTSDINMIKPDLVRYGASNLELLKWVHKNVPIFIVSMKQWISSKNVCSKEMMIWLYENLGIHPYDMTWAFEVGDLESIEWAKKNFYIAPITKKHSIIAAKRGHVHIIDWISMHYPKQLRVSDILKSSIEVGNLRVASHIMLKFGSREKIYVQIDRKVCMERRLEILKWVHTNGLSMYWSKEMKLAAEMGNLQVLLWLSETFPTIIPGSDVCEAVVGNGQHVVYKWLLAKHPGQCSMKTDIRAAAFNGHLEIIKTISDKEPLLVGEISKYEMNSSNYQVEQWRAHNQSMAGA